MISVVVIGRRYRKLRRATLSTLVFAGPRISGGSGLLKPYSVRARLPRATNLLPEPPERDAARSGRRRAQDRLVRPRRRCYVLGYDRQGSTAQRCRVDDRRRGE